MSPLGRDLARLRGRVARARIATAAFVRGQVELSPTAANWVVVLTVGFLLACGTTWPPA